MALDYCDSSAILKLYLPEIGSAWMEARPSVTTVAISSLCVVEVASAFARRVRDGSLTGSQQEDLYSEFESDLPDFWMIDVTQDVLQSAARLARNIPSNLMLRSLDAIHLATAVAVATQAKSTTTPLRSLITSNTRLAAVAQSAGLSVENPENYP